MYKKLLLFTSLISLSFCNIIYAQVIELKTGTFNLQNQPTSLLAENNEQAVYDNTFYGLVVAKEKVNIPEGAIISWLSKDVALIHLSLPQALQSKNPLYTFMPEWKLAPMTMDSLSTKSILNLRINLYQYTEKIAQEIKKYGKAGQYDALNKSIPIQIKSDSVLELMRKPFVFWAEFEAPALEMDNLRERTNHRVPLLTNFSTNHQLTGKGVVMGEWDGGGAFAHIDYQFRHTRIDPFFNNGNGQHATHVAGTMAGAGIKDPSAKGMAPEATFYSYDFFGNVPAEMDSACKKFGIEFTQNSYSYGSTGDPCTIRGTYDNTSVALDRLVNKYPNLLHVFASGNSRGSNCLLGGYGTVPSGFQASKNSISVGAVTFTDVNSNFHSYGPLRDGRLKPEICAVGVDVYSTFPNHAYQGGYSGTSMACPGTSGTAALITQLYKEIYDTVPNAHLIKGVLCNAADELGRPGPDYQYGFGRLNGFVAANIIDQGNFKQDSVNQSGTFSDTIFIDNPHLFKVMLCYTDLESTSAASTALVNDLDLTLTDDAGNVLQPWVLNSAVPTAAAVKGRDSLNNIEQITVETPTSSYYIYTVKGQRVASGYQHFSVNWLEQDTSLTLVYPNGGEKWLPPANAGTMQTIRWDAYGISGTGTLTYSIDSGRSWTSISTNVNLSQGYFDWQNCPSNVITGKALIKIGKGNYVDSSNAVFDIFQTGPVANAVSCSKQLHITWNAIDSAVGYFIYMHDSGKMKIIAYTTDRFFTIKDLADTLSYWIALSPVAANGAEGPRGIAREFSTNAAVQAPSFTFSPRDSNVCSGSRVFFASNTIGTGTIIRAWQVSRNHGTTWLNIAGSNSDLLILNQVFIRDDSSKYRLTARNSCQSLEISDLATLKVDSVLPFSYASTFINMCIGQDTILQITQAGNNNNLADWYHIASPSLPAKLLAQNTATFWNIDSVQITNRGRYYAQLKNSCGLQQSSKIIILEVNEPLQLNLSGEDTICFGQTANNIAIAQGGRPSKYTYFWQLDTQMVNSQNLTRAHDSTEVWRAAVFDFCSADTVFNTKTIVVRSVPKIALPKDTTICKGTSLEISAMGSGGNAQSYNYLWSNNLPNNKIVSVSPLITTTYFLTFTDSCSTPTDAASIKVSVLEDLAAEITSSKDTFCTNELQTIAVKGAGGDSSKFSFVWDDGSTAVSRMVSANSDSTFYVQLMDNCTIKSGTDSFKVKVRRPLSIQISGSDTLCFGEEAIFTALPSGGLLAAYAFDWINSTNSTITVKGNLDTLITVQLTDGCTPQPATGQKQITVRKPLEISPITDRRTCRDSQETILLKGIGGKANSYQFFVNEQVQSSPTYAKYYTDSTKLYFRLSDNCSSTDALDSMWIDIRPIFPIIFDIKQENLLVKAKTSNDGSQNWWGTNTNNLTKFPSNTAEVNYPNFGPVWLCLQKIDDAGCAETFCKALELFDVFETENIKVSIYPNPAKDKINLSLNKIAGDIKVNLITMDGKYVWRQQYSTFNQTLFTFDVSALASTFYILEIEVNKQIIHKKILVD